MLTTVSTDYSTRTGRAAEDQLFTSRGVTHASRTGASRRAVSRFGEVLGSQETVSGQTPSSQGSGATSAASRAGLSQTVAQRTPQASLIIPYRRGTSAQSADTSAPLASPSGFKTTGPQADGTAVSPGPKAASAEVTAFQLEWGARYLPDAVKWPYMNPNEIVGSIAPRAAGAEEGNRAFASNLYRVPEWGLQEFVTSDGSRHRFDVEVVFPEAGASTWLGNQVGRIHPEVADFVVENLRKTMAEGGIPASAIADIRVYRAFGGPGERPFYMDSVQFVRADGEKFSGSMNIYMRDPKHTLQILKDFFQSEIPS